MLVPHNIPLQKNFFRWSQYMTVFVIANGVMILTGWQFDIETLKHPLPVTLATNPLSASLFVLSGISFLLLSSKKASTGWIQAGKIIAGIVLLFASLKTTSILLRTSIPVDALLYPGKIKIPGSDRFVGMATNTAFSFVLLSLSLMFLNVETRIRKRRPSHYIALVIALISLLSIIGYINKVQKPIFGNPLAIPLGIHAAICFFFLSVSVLFANPDKGLTKGLTSKYTGSVIARMLIPVVIIIPAAIGFLRLISHWNNAFPPEVGTTIVVFIIILIFLLFLWYTTMSLNKRDEEHEAIEIVLKENEDQIQTIFRFAPDAVIVIDEKGIINNWNPKAETIFGWKATDVIGKPLRDTIIPHRFREAHDTGMKYFLKTGEGPVLNKTIEIAAINKENLEFPVSLSISPTKVKDKYVFIGFIRDITEQRKAEENIRYNALLLENVSDAVISTDENLLIKSWNDTAEKMYGYKKEEVIGKNISVLRIKMSREQVALELKTLNEQGFYKDEYTALSKAGDEITILASVNVISANNKIQGYVAVHRDITLRKQLEDQLKAFNEDLAGQVEAKTAEIKNVFERVSDAFVAVDVNWFYTYVNSKAEQIFNRKPGYLIGKNMWTEFPEAVGHAVQQAYQQAMHQQQYVYLDEYYPESDRWFENHIYPSPEGLSIYFRDITEKKKAEEKLAQNEKRFRALVENNEGIISLIDEKFDVLFRSSSAARITGWTNDEFERTSAIEQIHPDDREGLQSTMAKALASPATPFPVQLRVKHKKGHYIWLEGVINNMLHDPGVGGLITNVRDVTERIDAEQKIIKANRLYFFISQVNQMIVRTKDELTLFQEACNIAVEVGKFRMAWIGMIDDETKKVIPVMHAGEDADYPSSIKQISVHENPEGRGPTGTALREGMYTICNDIESDPQMAPWKTEATNRGYKSCMALPIKKFEKVVGVFSFYMAVKDFFDLEEIALLKEATSDVSFALELFEKERLQQEADELIIANEKRFRKLVENGNDAFVILTPEGKPLYISSSVERVLGYTEEEAFKLDLFTLTHPDDMEEVQKTFMKALENPGMPIAGYTSRLLHKDGTWRWFEDTITNLIDDPDIGGVVDNFRDVTEKVAGEQALRESEERYRSLIEQASDAIFINNPDGYFLDVNESACAMLGYTKQQLCKMKVEDLYTAKELTERPIMQKELSKGIRTSIERNMLHSKGTEIPVDITAKMLSDGRTIAIVRDISERKKIEDAIHKSNERFELIGKAANDAVWEWNLETNEVWGNETHQQLYGLTMADPVPHDEEWRKRLHDEDRENIVKSIEKTLASKKSIWDAEYLLKTENKGWINVYGRTYIERNKEGKPVRMLGSMMDITKQKEVEQQIVKEKKLSDSIINSLPGVFYLFDTTPRFLRWNNFFKTISGYSDEEIGTMEPMILFDQSDQVIMKQQIAKAYSEGYSYAETSLVTRAGQKIPFYFTGVLVNYEGKHCILGTGIDISKKKKAEDELLQMNHQLREFSDHLQNIREEERLKMSREIHDELGQLLTVMKMDVSWLHKEIGVANPIATSKTEALKAMLDETVKSVRRISSELRPSVLDDMGLAAAIKWHLDEFQKRSGIKTILLQPDIELKLSETVSIGLFRIVQESLTNVARYAQASKVTVNLLEENNELWLSIEDDGVGFDKEKIAFKKTLGILGMKERTNMMGGAYEIKSETGKGTTVTVKIPLG